MNPGNCYLYEYENIRKVRNVGFFKITRHYHTCILQIQARGISVHAKSSVDLYVFYQDGERSIAKKLASLSCMEHSLSVRISVSESVFPQGRTLERIDGFFLKASHTETQKFWVVSHIVPQNIIPYEEASLSSEDSSSEMPEHETPAKDTSADKSPSPTPPTEDASLQESSPEENSAAKTPPEASESDNHEAPATTPAAEAPPEDPAVKETTASENSLKEEPAEPHSFSTLSAKETSGHSSARKINRSELCLLPKKYWFLANNSFLLHGYHNYNHLLLVEEDGHYWLGVPGIYDSHEARAANLFGFPQFTRSYTEALHLEEEERNDDADFGHWCRYIK